MDQEYPLEIKLESLENADDLLEIKMEPIEDDSYSNSEEIEKAKIEPDEVKQEEKEDPPRIPIPYFSTKHMSRCSLCSKFQMKSNFKRVSAESEKLLLSTASVLCGELTIDRAKLFMFGCQYKRICRDHLSKTIDTIYSTLGIKSITRMKRVSEEKSKMVTDVMESISPSFDATIFLKNFRQFVKRNTRILNRYL